METLDKKLILTGGFGGLNEAAKLDKQDEMAAAHNSHIALFPTLEPLPVAVITKLAAQRALYVERENQKEILKNLTEKIKAGNSDINDIFIDDWRPQVQAAIAGDLAKAKLLGWGAKGQATGKTPVEVSITKEEAAASYPMISRVDINKHLNQALSITNNITGKRKLPAGILRIDVYGQTGGTQPTDYTQMGRAMGQATRGKFGNQFSLTDLGKTQYYIATYVDKKTKTVVAQSPVMSAIIN